MAAKALPSPEVLRQLLRYEPETGKLLWLPRKHVLGTTKRATNTFNSRRAGSEAFTCLSTDGYLIGAVLGVSLRAHRVAWAIQYEVWPCGMIDHIDGNRANNRINNLRVVTPAENARNAAHHKNSPHPYPGIRRHNGRWIAFIGSGGSSFLGAFETLDEALMVRKRAEQDFGYHQNHGRNTHFVNPWGK